MDEEDRRSPQGERERVQKRETRWCSDWLEDERRRTPEDERTWRSIGPLLNHWRTSHVETGILFPHYTTPTLLRFLSLSDVSRYLHFFAPYYYFFLLVFYSLWLFSVTRLRYLWILSNHLRFCIILSLMCVSFYYVNLRISSVFYNNKYIFQYFQF